MNLAEALVASAMFATSSSCSLQLWAGSSQWLRQADGLQQQAAQLEAALLAGQAELAALAGTPVAADCTTASSWLVAHLQGQSVPAGLTRQLQAEANGLVRLQLSDASGQQRQRWFSPLAYGLCDQPEPKDAAPADSEPGDTAAAAEHGDAPHQEEQHDAVL